MRSSKHICNQPKKINELLAKLKESQSQETTTDAIEKKNEYFLKFLVVVKKVWVAIHKNV